MPSYQFQAYNSPNVAGDTNNVPGVVVRNSDGSINVGQTNAVGVVNSGVSTTSVGGSTAATGSSVSDAAGLPAGTAEVYPVTAADGTKGVKIDVADQVTGRRIVIANLTAAVLKIYPPTGGAIGGAAANAAYSTGSGKSATIICTSSGSQLFAVLG